MMVNNNNNNENENESSFVTTTTATTTTTNNNNNDNDTATDIISNTQREQQQQQKKRSSAPAVRKKDIGGLYYEQSMFRDISRRQWDPQYHKRRNTTAQCMKHPSIVKGMRLLRNLEKHGGCVNAVSWNEDASLLISGSDDMTVVVWSTGTNFPVKGSVFTGHTHNVFDAQFVPNCNSSKCVTTAADGQVRLIDLERGFSEKPPNHYTNRYMRNMNHDSAATQQLWSGDGAGMGMKIIFLPGSNNSFLSTHQDGCVRLFDIREGTTSRREIVIDLTSVGAASDIAFDPTAPHTFAVGCDDPIVRVFDIRHHVAKLTRTSEDYYAHAHGPSPGTSPLPSPPFGLGGSFFNRRPSLGGSPNSTTTIGSPVTPNGSFPRAAGLPSSPPSRSSGFVERCLPTVAEYCPGLAFGALKKFQGEEDNVRSSFRSRRFEGISGIAFSKTGELACTYKGEDVYVLETRKVSSSVKIDLLKHDCMDELERRYEGCAKKYEGRKNTRTFLKGVAFMCGDEYVTTGGDCGNIFVWNKKTTKLVCKLQGDSQVVNNVIPHPHLPVLAASGIDSDIKIFEASNDGEHIAQIPEKDENNDFDSSDGDEDIDDDDDDDDDDIGDYVQVNTRVGVVVELLRRRQEGRDFSHFLPEGNEDQDSDDEEDSENSSSSSSSSSDNDDDLISDDHDDDEEEDDDDDDSISSDDDQEEEIHEMSEEDEDEVMLDAENSFDV